MTKMEKALSALWVMCFLIGIQVWADETPRGFNRAITGFRDTLAAHEGADALFFYAGHGMQADGNNYLIPVKTDFDSLDDIKSDAISIQSVTNAIQQAKASVSLIILDACRDNPFAKKMSRSLGGTRGLTVVQTGGGASGSAILFSTSPGDVALDGNGRNGVFTSALLKYINSDLKIEDLFKKVTGEMHQQSAGAQNPWINASLSSDFYFISDTIRTAHAAEAAEAARQADLAAATVVATTAAAITDKAYTTVVFAKTQGPSVQQAATAFFPATFWVHKTADQIKILDSSQRMAKPESSATVIFPRPILLLATTRSKPDSGQIPLRLSIKLIQ